MTLDIKDPHIPVKVFKLWTYCLGSLNAILMIVNIGYIICTSDIGLLNISIIN